MQGSEELLEASFKRKPETMLTIRGESGFNGFLKHIQFKGPCFIKRIQIWYKEITQITHFKKSIEPQIPKKLKRSNF